MRELEYACRLASGAWEPHYLLGRILWDRAQELGGDTLITGRAVDEAAVVPRHAVVDGQVWIVTPDEVGDGGGLSIRTWVNDELRQDSNTRELIFDCATIVETLSTVFTLEPGDVVATGTPDGVGAAMDPPGWLVDGDVVKIEIERIGTLENPVVAD